MTLVVFEESFENKNMNSEIEVPKRKPQDSIISSRIRWNPLKADFSDTTGFHSGPRSKRSRWQHALWSWFSSAIDILILISLSTSLLIVFSMIFKKNPEIVWMQVLASQSTASFVTQAFFLTAWLYFVASRFFLGATLGELSCQVQLGTEKQRQNRPQYLLKVLIRETLMVFTGLLVLPLISLLLAKDFVGEIIDLKLYSLK